jgi:hypothetical protein
MMPNPLIQSLPRTGKAERCAYCSLRSEDLVSDVLERNGRPIPVRVCADELGCARRVRDARGRGPTSPAGMAVA